MKKPGVLLQGTVFVLMFAMVGCVARPKPVEFALPHNQNEECASFWLQMEQVIEKNNTRCMETGALEGYPYLRGNKELLTYGNHLLERKQKMSWVELMRRVDLKARYQELDKLPSGPVDKLCGDDKSLCSMGQIKARVAKCSARLLGEDKQRNVFLETQFTESFRFVTNGESCFEDKGTLDGLFPATEGERMRLLNATGASGRASGLQKRINNMKIMQKK